MPRVSEQQTKEKAVVVFQENVGSKEVARTDAMIITNRDSRFVNRQIIHVPLRNSETGMTAKLGVLSSSGVSANPPLSRYWQYLDARACRRIGFWRLPSDRFASSISLR
jgi:mRNA-degrading endonuclease toxin of MazEF toxin-antitoxin module